MKKEGKLYQKVLLNTTNPFDKAKVYDEMDYAQTKLLITEFLSRNKSQTRDNL